LHDEERTLAVFPMLRVRGEGEGGYSVSSAIGSR
jgi:hypothetical protein